jgi:predicted patatin/cPLA2 family phospholipase
MTEGRGKLGLVIEGGAMRGVISAAALSALEELGYTEVFDDIYGASAGAVNGAYFMAGQAAYATAMYYQFANSAQVMKPLWRGKRVDLDYLFDIVISRLRPLRVEKVLAGPTRLHVVLADSATGEAFLVNPSESRTPMITILKASSAMPLLYNKFVTVDGRKCFDGGMINSIPILDAVRDGCTDLLVLLTRPRSFREQPPTALEHAVFRRCSSRNPRLMSALESKCLHSNEIRDLALGRSSLPGVRMAVICPDDDEPEIERTERGSEVLKEVAIASIKRTLRAFGFEREEFIEVLRPFPYIR